MGDGTMMRPNPVLLAMLTLGGVVVVCFIIDEPEFAEMRRLIRFHADLALTIVGVMFIVLYAAILNWLGRPVQGLDINDESRHGDW
ncbi:hypothetical protein AA0472_2347 [Acetobacter estunensis NRIC 0472]|nr:hypothetical protein AA0472_2347 [Acetobacter estunensis NRIC 0472]